MGFVEDFTWSLIGDGGIGVFRLGLRVLSIDRRQPSSRGRFCLGDTIFKRAPTSVACVRLLLCLMFGWGHLLWMVINVKSEHCVRKK